MGLDLSYREVHQDHSKKLPDAAGCRKYRIQDAEENAWYNLGQDTETAICKVCPLECESEYWHNRGIFGCYIRMGSYGYVASLHEFCRENRHISLLSNPFVLATEGGGYHHEILGVSNQDMLNAINTLRKALSGLTSEAAVPYKNGERVEEFGSIGASPMYDSIGGLDWFASIEGVRYSVHYKHGIAIINERYGIDNTQYTKRTTDPKICELMLPFGHDRSIASDKIDEVVFETIPALERFDHLLDTAERITRKAAEFGLTVEGC